MKALKTIFLFLIISLANGSEKTNNLSKQQVKDKLQHLINSGFDADILKLSAEYGKYVKNQKQWREEVSSFPIMTVPEMIQYWGYPVENHMVTTADGYILDLHRIRHGANKNPTMANNTQRPVVFLGHALECSSSEYTFGPANKSLAYILADKGYDVWLGNTRGSTYSKNHIHLDPSSAEFWDFGFHEAGTEDLTASIDVILGATGAESVYYVGHSQGTTEYLIMLSERPEYNEKIKAGFLLAPVAFMTHSTNSVFLLAEWGEEIKAFLDLLGIYEIAPHNAFFTWIGNVLCNVEIHPIITEICLDLAFWFANVNEDGKFNETMIPLYLDHLPAGSSAKPFVHYAQLFLTDNEFVQYDYGKRENAKRYNGSETPPPYNLANVVAPTALFVGEADDLGTVEDNNHLAEVLPNCFHHEVIDEKWSHLDFAIAIDAPEKIYSTITSYIEQFEYNPNILN